MVGLVDDGTTVSDLVYSISIVLFATLIIRNSLKKEKGKIMSFHDK